MRKCTRTFNARLQGWLLLFWVACQPVRGLLRRPSARDVARPLVTHPVQSILSLTAGVLLLPFATLAMLAESLWRCGGTVEIYAERPEIEGHST